jgi:hypothetical protein
MPDRRLVQSLSKDAVLDLQRSAGNRSVAQLFGGMGNASVAQLMRKDDKEKPKEGEDDKGGGILGIVSNVNKAIAAVSKIQQAWDEVFKDKVTTTFTALPPLMSDEARIDLNRALRYETSRLVCEYVFEKGKLAGVDIRKLVDDRKKGATPEPGAPTGRPELAALAKDLDGLTELALGDLKDRAAKLIAQRRQPHTPKPARFWWNERNDWGIFGPPPRFTKLAGGVPKELEYGEVFFRPQVSGFGQPMNGGLHADVRYFGIPDLGTEVVAPRWWLGGQVETKAHGRNVNAVTVDVVDPVPDANKPMGEYRIVVTFDWDESNTLLRCVLQSAPEQAFIFGIEREGEPDVGWV